MRRTLSIAALACCVIVVSSYVCNNDTEPQESAKSLATVDQSWEYITWMNLTQLVLKREINETVRQKLVDFMQILYECLELKYREYSHNTEAHIPDFITFLRNVGNHRLLEFMTSSSKLQQKIKELFHLNCGELYTLQSARSECNDRKGTFIKLLTIILGQCAPSVPNCCVRRRFEKHLKLLFSGRDKENSDLSIAIHNITDTEQQLNSIIWSKISQHLRLWQTGNTALNLRLLNIMKQIYEIDMFTGTLENKTLTDFMTYWRTRKGLNALKFVNGIDELSYKIGLALITDCALLYKWKQTREDCSEDKLHFVGDMHNISMECAAAPNSTLANHCVVRKFEQRFQYLKV